MIVITNISTFSSALAPTTEINRLNSVDCTVFWVVVVFFFPISCLHVVHVSEPVIDSYCCLLCRALGRHSLDYFTGNKEKLVTAGPEKRSGLARFTGSWFHYGLGSPQGSAAMMSFDIMAQFESSHFSDCVYG